MKNIEIPRHGVILAARGLTVVQIRDAAETAARMLCEADTLPEIVKGNGQLAFLWLTPEEIHPSTTTPEDKCQQTPANPATTNGQSTVQKAS